MSVIWPGTTEAFEQTKIYARASGYISRRNVDIGSRVKAGQLLVEITAPELDHQIAQAEGTLAQMQASLEQAKANVISPRSLGIAITLSSRRDGSPTTRRHRSFEPGGATAGVGVAAANVTAQEALPRGWASRKLTSAWWRRSMA